MGIKVKVENFVVGVVVSNNGLLNLVRDVAKDGEPLSGYRFPRCKLTKAGKAETVKALFKKIGHTEVAVLHELTEVTGLDERGRLITLYPIILHSGHNTTAIKGIEPALVNVNKIDSVWMDSVDRKLAEKIGIYLPLLAGPANKVQWPSKELKEVDFYLNCIAYFGNKIAASELSDFSLLCQRVPDIHGVRAAFKWIMNRYNVDFNEYIDRKSFEENKGKKSK